MTDLGHAMTDLGHAMTDLGHAMTDLGHAMTDLSHVLTSSVSVQRTVRIENRNPRPLSISSGRRSGRA